MKLKKKARRMILTILIIFLVVLLGFVILKKINSDSTDHVKDVKVLDKLDDYGYSLKENKPSTYKNMFNELKKILNEEKVNEEEYAKKITEMFIYDFYSLDDKTAKTDIGGVEFVYGAILENFLQNAQNTYYKYVESNIYNNRNQLLPIVKDIEITNVEKKAFGYGSEIDEEAYFVSATWDYTNTEFSTYQKEATLVFIHDGKKLSLVELQ